MLTVTEYSVELIKDPFGIVPGKRYEFLLDIDVPEEDELFSDKGVYIRVIYGVEESRTGILKYEFFEKSTDRYLEFEMDEDEEKEVSAFCKEHIGEAEE